MVKLILGKKGEGKTKNIIDLVRAAAENESGAVVCMTTGTELTFDIPYSVRLIDTKQYGITGIDYLKGFINGLKAGNFDVAQIFVDGLLKIVGELKVSEIESFLDWCDAFGDKEDIKFTVSFTYDAEDATPGLRKYM